MKNDKRGMGRDIRATKNSHVFVDKDKDLLRVVKMIEDDPRSMKAIAEKSGVSYTTLKNWQSGPTKRSLHPTLKMVARICGYDMEFVPRGTKRK